MEVAAVPAVEHDRDGPAGEGVERPEPEPTGTDVAALLDEAENIVNSAAPDIMADFENGKPKRKFLRRNKKKKKK